jgi:hypothetical protein
MYSAGIFIEETSMRNEHATDDPGNLWRNQDTDPTVPPLDEIRRRARKLQRRVARRNLREYAAAFVVVAFFGWALIHRLHPLERTGLALCIAGVLYVCYRLHRSGSAKGLPQEAGSTAGLQFYRRELERQRDLLRGVWRWYIGPLIPGLAVLTLASAIVNPGHLGHPRLFAAGYAAFAGLVLYLIGKWNRRAAARLQRQIEELRAWEENS